MLRLRLLSLLAGLGLGVGAVGVLQSDAQLVHVSLQLLLLPNCLTLGAGLVLQGGLHRLDGLRVSLLQGVQLVTLLLDPSLDLLFHLSQLKLGPQHLVLLLLEGTLSFFKSCLKLKLLAFQAFPDFVNLVDGSTTLADLVHDVLDLSAEGFIFPPDAIKLTVGLIVGCLPLEQLRRVAATLHLGLVQLTLEPLDLVLPLSNDLVEVACLLLHRHAAGFRILHGNDGLLYFRLQLRLLPLEGHRFAIEVADTALSFSKSRLELHFRRLSLLGLGETLLLVLLPPHLRISNRLREKAKSIVLRSSLLLQLALCQVHLVLEVPVPAQQEGSLLGLGLGNLVHLVQLLSQGLPKLPKHRVVVLQLFNAVEKLSIFDDNLLPRVVVVAEGEVSLLSPAGDVQPLLLKKSVLLLQGRLLVGHHVHGSSDLLYLEVLGMLLLLHLAAHLVQLVHLFRHLSSGIAVLLLQALHSRLVLDVGLFKVSPQLVDLSLTLLVQLNLGSSCTSSLIKSLAQVVKLSGKSASLLLGLAASLSLRLELLLGRLDPGLQLLDRLLRLGNNRLLILQATLAHNNVLILLDNRSLDVLLLPLQVSHLLLAHLQVRLHLPALFVHLKTRLLLPIVGILQLVESDFQLSLDLVQVFHLLLGRGELVT